MTAIKSADMRAMQRLLDQEYDPVTGCQEEMHPFAFAAKANSEDTPTWEQAMYGPDKQGYLEACKQELRTLKEKKDAWDVVNRESWMKVLPSTWAFRCKRYPDGSVRKLKARFCARGDRQVEGIDYFETFAPVVNWQTVRLLLVLSAVLGLATRQVDYTAAFIHAPIDKDPNYEKLSPEEQKRSGVYLEMPRGFRENGKVLKLKRSLYGLRQSPRNFFLFIKEKLQKVGLEPQEVDPCLFMSDKVILLVYVDDTLLFSPKKEWIDEVINKLRAEDVDLEEEDDVAGFLGVHIERNARDQTIKLTQKGLTQRIIDALGVEKRPRALTPALRQPLVADKDGIPAEGLFNYASVIGMLLYLTGHTRPDLQYAVSQCARYTHAPKKTHEQALQRIGCYLKHTVDQGLVMKPNLESLNVDCYVDADFAGLWPHEDKQDPSCVKSRTGFAICVANCPIIWVSKLQPDIATSTMEAEYNALSMAMKSVLPLLELLRVVGKQVGLSEEQLTSFKTTVWEDNAGALTLANLEPGRITPRSKFYAIRYHWFRSHLKPNRVQVEKIDSKDQRADLLTKQPPLATFQATRKLLCGW